MQGESDKALLGIVPEKLEIAVRTNHLSAEPSLSGRTER